MTLQGKTVFITGASRGIGLAISLRAARDGANVVIAAKTSAVKFALGGGELMERSRTPEILGDAAHPIFCRPARSATGQFYPDDEVLWAEGATDFSRYACNSAAVLVVDLFVDPAAPAPIGVRVGYP